MRAVKGNLDHSLNRCLKQGEPRSMHAVETTLAALQKTDREKDAETEESTREDLTAFYSRNALKQKWLWRIVHEQ